MCCCVQTGTLTEGDLDLAGVCEVRDGQFQESVADPQVDTLSVAVLSNGHVAHLHFDQMVFSVHNIQICPGVFSGPCVIVLSQKYGFLSVTAIV